MAKRNHYLDSMFPPKKIFDENAFSISVIGAHYGVRRSQACNIAAQKIAAGEWEQVWKHGGRGYSGIIKAYRPALKIKIPSK